MTRKDEIQENVGEFVSTEQVLIIIENNRGRIRTLANMVLTVCGLLLPTSFVVLFFVLADTKFNISWVVPALVFASSASLTVSIFYSILSAYPHTPSGVVTNLELIDLLTTALNREYRRATVAVVFLFVSIILFMAALGAFGLGLLM
jgi:hypothetical protein